MSKIYNSIAGIFARLDGLVDRQTGATIPLPVAEAPTGGIDKQSEEKQEERRQLYGVQVLVRETEEPQFVEFLREASGALEKAVGKFIGGMGYMLIHC